MIVRVEVESVGARMDLEGAAWTPELLETLLRMCSDEVIRICQTLGLESEEVTGDDVDTADGVEQDE